MEASFSKSWHHARFLRNKTLKVIEMKSQAQQAFESIFAAIAENPEQALSQATELMDKAGSAVETLLKSQGAKKMISGFCQIIGETYRQLAIEQKLPPEVAATIICRTTIMACNPVRKTIAKKNVGG